MLTPGAVFAGYQVERILGRGGMGDVYLARHPRLPRSDALKLMSEELSRNEVYRQRFSSEADIACQVQHDSVVRVYDRGEDDGRLWLAMEYIDGRDLAQLLASEGRVPPERAVALLERIAAGLDAIHARGLLHRDVKPANILVARDMLGAPRALLTDFGIARSAADSLGLTGVGDVVATLHYAAPEQFELRSGELDRRVDVYALGCVLYEMLTGRVPLQGDSVAAFWRVMQSEIPTPPSREVAGITPQVDAVLAKALSKRREDRYDSAGELARAARAAIASAPAYTPTPTPTPAPVTLPYTPPHTGPTGPYRIGLRRDDAAAPGGFRQYGPISTEQLPPPQAQRLSWLIDASNIFTLPASLTGGWGPSTAMTVEGPGRFHTVSWSGQPPPVLSELVNDVERLGAGNASPGAPRPDVAVPPGPPEPKPSRRGRRGRLLALLAGVVVIAVGVSLTLVLVGGKKPVPGLPAGVTVTAGRGTVTVRWTPGTGKTDHYLVYRDGRDVASTVTGTSYTDDLTDTATHGYTVQAVNRAGRASGVTSPLPIAAEVRALNAGENALLDKLPSTLVDNASCQPILSGVDSHLTTAVTCDPKAGQSPSPPAVVPKAVEVYGAANVAALKAALTADITAHAAKSGDCSATPQQGTWNFTETPKVINGQIICYTAAPTSYLLWSYNTALLYIRISTTSPYAGLLKYWQNASLHLP
jgi:serine/threonine protein kinase